MVIPSVRLNGLEATALGLGLAAVGRPGYINLGRDADLGSDRSVAALEQRAHDVLDAAYGAGVRYFDAARSYGRAEEFLASWLRARQVAPGAVTVGSKWGYIYTAGWKVDAQPPEVKDHSVENFRHQAGETMDLLGPWLSLYQIHSATLDTGVLEDPAVLDALAELRGQGVAIGLTTSGTGQAETIEQALAGGGFDCVQATYNLLERAPANALERAHDAGLGVIVKEALANGRLTSRGGIDPLLRAAERLGTTPDALAIAAVLAEPWVDVVLSGAETVEQVQSNVAAVEVDVTPALAGELAALREPSDGYWSTRSALSWA
jgi:aryl-alcohol dehydrogenase-like predicted oxidoreductase